ncbi:MAG: DegV family protein [Acetilactobacillus jinshanensis]
MIHIVTDSTSVVNRADAKKYGITVIPLTITLGQHSYLDGISVNSDQVDQYNDTHRKDISRSSQPPIGKFVQAFKNLTQNGDSVLAILLGDNFSGTYNVACQAGQMVKGTVKVINSKTTDQSLRHMVVVAAQMANQKKYSMDQIVKQVDEIRQHSALYMGISTLRNLRKNGRINMFAGVLSFIFHLYIVVNLDLNQKLHISAKGRGRKTFLRWMPRYLKSLKGQSIKYMGISYTGDARIPETLAQKIQQEFPKVPMILRHTSATITCHTGENAFAVMTCTK